MGAGLDSGVFLLSDRSFFAMAVAVYGLSMVYSIRLWRRGFRQDNRVNYVLLVIAFGLHSLAMGKRGFSLERCPVNNLYEALVFVSWTIAGAYLVLGVWRRLRFLGAFASPILFVIGVFALLPALDVPYEGQPEALRAWASLHAALILLAYGAFGVSSAAGLMYLSQEHDLKFRKLRAALAILPPIQGLEIFIGVTLATGFVLLTLGLVVSPFLLQHKYGVYFKPDPKILWSLLVWCLYLGLLVMRWRFHSGGRRFAWGAVAGFAFVLFTFWGFNLLSAVHQD